jgi:glycosyltransferase involved in cell wall biosynthesis
MLTVSIVTPAYNQASFLEETIASVLGQDYPRIEYAVIDDGSTDETPTVLERYRGRLRAVSRPNKGQTATINEGFAAASGDVLLWLNSDDTLLPGAVSAAVRHFEEHPEDGIVYGDTLFTDAAGRPLRRSRAQERFEYDRFVRRCENPIPQPSAFLRKRVVEDIGTLDPHFYYFMDWDFWLRAGLRHRIAYMPTTLSTYRLHDASKTVARQAEVAPELEYMYARFFARDDLPEPVRRLRREAMACMLLTSAGYFARGGRPEDASRAGRRALRTYPELILRPALARQLAFCLAGSTPFYSMLRALRGRGTPSS